MERHDLEHPTGDRVALDHEPGNQPGWLYLHGLGSVRAGEKSETLMARARRSGRAATRLDFRGHGESSGVFGEVTLTDMIEDGAAALRAFGPCYLIGSSMGGMVAAWLAARYRDLVPGLVLLSPAFGFLQQLAAAQPTGDAVTFPGHDQPYTLHRRVFDDAAQYDEASLPGRIRVPTLVVHGSEDDVIPQSVSERFFASLAAAQKDLWVIEGEDHRLNRSFAAILERAETALGIVG